jgi:hypothetical protein
MEVLEHVVEDDYKFLNRNVRKLFGMVGSMRGKCETWVHSGPHRPGSRPSPTSGFRLPEDPPTCQWAQPT